MKQNPIYKKETLQQNRSYILPLLLTAMNAVLSILVVINLYSLQAGARQTGEIAYGDFLRIYGLIAGLEFLLLLLLMPALTASAVTGERERRTLGILLSTGLTPAVLIRGKLLAALDQVLLLLASTAPSLATVYIYGGVGALQLLALIVFYFVTALYLAAIGIAASAFSRSTFGAATLSYILTILSVALFIFLFYMRGELGVGLWTMWICSLVFMLLWTTILLYFSIWRLKLPRVCA